MIQTMNQYMRSSASAVLMGLMLVACTESQSEEESTQAPDLSAESPRESESTEESSASTVDLTRIAEETVALIQAIRGEAPVKEVVDFEQLDRVLPKKLADLPQVSRTGETNSIGLGLSGVEAEYGDSEASVTLAIFDLAPYSSLSGLLFTEWTRGAIDRQTHQGYERTRHYEEDDNTWPAYERVHIQGDDASCQIKVWVAHRFLVSIEGEGSDESICNEARMDISFRRLERLAASQQE